MQKPVENAGLRGVGTAAPARNLIAVDTGTSLGL
jgi:hypothetical protein